MSDKVYKINEGFMLRNVAGNYVVVAVGKASKKFNGMINLNSTSAFMFECLINGMTEMELVNKVLEEYEISEEVCKRDVKAFLEALVKNGIVE